MNAQTQRELIGEILWRKDLPAAPAGENYFAFGIIIETNDPILNDLCFIAGDWQMVIPVFKKFMAELWPVNCSVSIFQGDDARKEMKTALTNEKRWQQQRRAQSFN